MKSSISKAVVFGSTVTGFSTGGGGTLTPAYTSTMSTAPAGAVDIDIVKAAAAVATRIRFIEGLLYRRTCIEPTRAAE
jgi:hypothetical protein